MRTSLRLFVRKRDGREDNTNEVTMNVIEKIKKAFGRAPILTRDQVMRLRRMTKDQARRELGAVLYEQCVNRAMNFVNGELKRGDSPYRGASASVFFHEIVAVSFWIVDKEITGGKQGLLQELHNNYFRSFSSSDRPEERHNFLMEKYEHYEDTWNEITGHLDEFGLCVVQNIFGKEESSRARERTFWIIQYADEIVNAFSVLRKPWKEIGG